MKEMLGGCCVCSDERGWTENPLVYCDGQGCTVAVHQACYGIVTVPTGPWYCRKCESQERSARVRCELCPSRDGALKRTDQAGWAHVVCALYIPEVRFGNVTTMEPIILQLIPSERFNKTCYICEEQGRGSRATVGACMQCNKTGCKQQFHVTCAQALGLLCEEAGNYLDNVKYCGYCQHHYSKLKKGGNVKTIPPYKPIPADNGSSDSSPEKEVDVPLKTSTAVKRKSASVKSSTLNLKNKLNASPSLDVNGVINDKNGSGRNTPKDTILSSTPGSSKFTTSNFVETVVTQSESVFGHESSSASNTIVSDLVSATIGVKTGASINFVNKNNNQSKSSSSSSNKLSYTSKKRKTGAHTPTALGSENSNNSASSEASGSVVAVSSITQLTPSNSVQPTVTEATSLSTTSEPEKLKLKIDNSLNSNTSSISITTESTAAPVIMSSPSTQAHTTTATSIVVSVPLAATSLPNFVQSVVTSAPTLYQQLQQSMSTTAVINESLSDSFIYSEEYPPEDLPAKKSRLQSTEKQEKVKKTKRGSTSNSQPLPIPPLPISTIASSNSNTSISIVKTSKRNLNRNNHQTPSLSVAPISSVSQGTTPGTGNFSSITSGTGNTMRSVVKDSPPSSPSSESMSSTGPGRRKKKSVEDRDSITPLSSMNMIPTTLGNNTKEEKDVKLFQNGVNAPHMLGNQLNPSSTMAQKMSDTLNQELEAHSIFTEASNSSTTLVGPQLHNRVIASIRSNQSAAQPPTSFASVFHTNNIANTNISSSGALGGSAIPQTLDQLLERQWEQGSQFLMEQAQHFDIASLLSCLHQLRAENLRLEEHVNSLLQRRDHLLAVNARLAIPLTTQPNTHSLNNIYSVGSQSHQNSPHSDMAVGVTSSISRINRDSRVNNIYLPHSNSTGHSIILENGLSSDSSSPAVVSVSQYTHRGQMVAPQPSPSIRHSSGTSAYLQGQSSNIVTPVNTNNTGVVRNSSSTSESLRGITRSSTSSSHFNSINKSLQ
ncbi:protein AF-10 isoform X2 [Microplitis demolitor]|uniref:protein AF-10 isoform X2 n=1 Tax=Microplitis demolitor TaxID=69319 RepID=UPI0004CCA820|nr:protein AF-10 isoform X2 [Microplitis demolitor]